MCNLAIKYKTTVFSRLERVPCTDLFVVERGVVAKRGRLGVAGACFGTDVILSNDNLRDIGDAIALTFVQTISLTQSDIFDLLPEYPQVLHPTADSLHPTSRIPHPASRIPHPASHISHPTSYPQAYFIVRKAALRMALIRALVKAAAIVKRQMKADRGLARLSIVEIFDQAK